MPTCFVMQPFDGDKYDRRYEEIIAPAIQEADLEPYRVDRDPKVAIPIQEIEAGIRASAICVAEITEDNPNVWFELGYAFACNKDVVLLCSDERKSKFPFDIQHRTVLKYVTTSPSAYENLKGQITTKLRAYLENAEKMSQVSEHVALAKVEGLDQFEIVALVGMVQNLEDHDSTVSTYVIKRTMESSGFNKLAAVIALKTLTSKGLVYSTTEFDKEAHEEYKVYGLNDSGWDWILRNREKLVLRNPEKVSDPEEDPF